MVDYFKEAGMDPSNKHQQAGGKRKARQGGRGQEGEGEATSYGGHNLRLNIPAKDYGGEGTRFVARPRSTLTSASSRQFLDAIVEDRSTALEGNGQPLEDDNEEYDDYDEDSYEEEDDYVSTEATPRTRGAGPPSPPHRRRSHRLCRCLHNRRWQALCMLPSP